MPKAFDISLYACIYYKGWSGSEWILVGVANNSQRGTSDRVEEKMLLKNGTDVQGSIELAITRYH